jgi:hypothetical protein
MAVVAVTDRNIPAASAQRACDSGDRPIANDRFAQDVSLVLKICRETMYFLTRILNFFPTMERRRKPCIDVVGAGYSLPI